MIITLEPFLSNTKENCYCICGQDIQHSFIIRHKPTDEKFLVGCVCIVNKVGKNIAEKWRDKITQLNAERDGRICCVCRNHNRRHKRNKICTACEKEGWKNCKACSSFTFNFDEICDLCFQQNRCALCYESYGNPICDHCRKTRKKCEGCNDWTINEKWCYSCSELLFRRCEVCDIHITKEFKSKLPSWMTKCQKCYYKNSRS